MTSMESRDKHLRQRYGFDHTEYDRMLQIQGGCCAVCLSKDPGKGFRYFHIDHDHATGKVRGLLCAKCNQALGLLAENVEVVQRALNYLQHHNR